MELVGISKQVYESKYKYETDTCIDDTWRRVAKAIAAVEATHSNRVLWEDKFYDMLYNFKVLPGGRITAGAGTKHQFLLNCAVLGVKDSIESIYDTIKRSAVLAKSNYGTGFDFSTLRPKNSPLSRGGISSGPVSFMRVFDTSSSVIETGGGRRAASIGILRVDHPDIFEFIDAKRQEGVLTQFNISVAVTNEFMTAVKEDKSIPLHWDGEVYDIVKARDIYSKLAYSAFMYNDPGIIFVDEINKYNNGYYMYDLKATNPCGEIPLPEDGVCDLGSINLTRFIRNPFTTDAIFDVKEYVDTIHTLVRFLDNVLDASEYPYPEMKIRAQGDRRIGLCPVAGLGSALAMLQMPYDSPDALEWVESVCKLARDEAYLASINLAKEKGPFPNYQEDYYLQADFVKGLAPGILKGIKKNGIRNLALLTAPPLGTGSLIAKNISNGIEPIFALEYTRYVRQPDQSKKPELVEDYAWGIWKSFNMISGDEFLKNKPDYFKTAMEIDPIDHIKMQAVIQKHIDGSISKTANLPSTYKMEDYEKLLWFAYESGLKGFTTFREGSREGVLVVTPQKKDPETDVQSFKLTEKIGEALVNPGPVKRPRKLTGNTYQIPESDGKHGYCTINQFEGKPWEVFISSSGKYSEWYAAIGRLASRIMRKTGDVQGIIEELKEIGGENGYFTPEYGYMQSKPQHLGFILEEFVNELNPETKESPVAKGLCPQCQENEVVKEGGCEKCLSCGWSKCG